MLHSPAARAPSTLRNTSDSFSGGGPGSPTASSPTVSATVSACPRCPAVMLSASLPAPSRLLVGTPFSLLRMPLPLPLPLPLPTVSVWSASRKVKPAAPQPPAQVSAATAEDGRRNTARVPVGAVVGVAPRWRAAQAARAEWVAASDTTTSRRYDPPCRDLSCWGVPRQARQPPAMMPTLEHSTSTSSMLWVVSTTATPEASVADRMAPHIARRAPGSMPLLGSSRSTAWGMPAKAIARLSLRLLPPE